MSQLMLQIQKLSVQILLIFFAILLIRWFLSKKKIHDLHLLQFYNAFDVLANNYFYYMGKAYYQRSDVELVHT